MRSERLGSVQPGAYICGVDAPPSDNNEAVAQLKHLCPELLPAYEQLSAEMGWNEGERIGIYNVFGEVILPFLLYALDGHADNSRSSGPEWHISGKKHRKSTFRAQEVWKDIPDRETAHLNDLVENLYYVIDTWALSPDETLRNAVFIEMIEAGYVDLTCEDLILHAGPALRAMAERGHY